MTHNAMDNILVCILLLAPLILPLSILATSSASSDEHNLVQEDQKKQLINLLVYQRTYRNIIGNISDN